MKKVLAVLSGFGLSMFALQANAALVALDVAALGTEVSGDIDVVKAEALPIIFTIIALLIGIKVLKRLMNKV